MTSTLYNLVAFTATWDTGLDGIYNPVDADETITFDETETNIGNGMDSSTGIFTAPVSGTYSFSFSGVLTPHPMEQQNILLRVVCQNNESKTIDLNFELKQWNYDVTDDTDAGEFYVSYTWIMSLDQSDEIFLKLPNDYLMAGEFHGQFVMTQ